MNIGVDRPDEVALLTAIENSIDDIATGKMTAIEVIGVLEMAKLKIYQDNILISTLEAME
jgi:hypothetical protein